MTALITQADRQIAEHQLEQPTGDNALESYRRIAQGWPDDPAAAQLGERLSTTIWSIANDAEEAERWEEAAHYFAILNNSTLPPVPATAIMARSAHASANTSQGAATATAEPSAHASTSSSVPSEPAAIPSSQSGTSDAITILATRTAAVLSEDASRELAVLAMTRGDEAIGRGDVIRARRFYELAASNGLAVAATAVGRTYDPTYLQHAGALGLKGDAQMARQWYEKAIARGDLEARARLDQLPHMGMVRRE